MNASKPSATEAVSVIIPTYNRRDLLVTAIDSVLNQTWRNFELLVIDDGSDDGTDKLVASYGNRVRYFFQDNRGVSVARNIGIKKAEHDLLAFLDSDDVYAPEKLETQVAAMIANPGYLVSHTDEIWYRRGHLLNQKNRHVRNSGYIFARCLDLCAVGMSTAMVRRSLFDEVGFFDEGLACCEDYDLWLRASVKFPFLLVSRPLTIKNGGREDQLSVINRIGMDRFRIDSILKIIGAGELDQEQKSLAEQELVRKCLIYGRGCLKHGRETEGTRYLAIAEQYGPDADPAEDVQKKRPG